MMKPISILGFATVLVLLFPILASDLFADETPQRGSSMEQLGETATRSSGPPSSQPATDSAVKPGRGDYIGGAPSELSADETAKQLANPNTPLASLTLKNQWTHWDGSLLGPDGMDSETFLFQPSIPFPVNETDSIFFRPAFPYLLDQPVVDATGKVDAESGFGDMGMDLAFGRTSKAGFLTAVGLVAGIPIGADHLTSDTWNLGPELFVGKVSKKSVVGVLTNQQWDVSGPRETSLTTIQPIITFLPGGGWAIGSTGTSSYNWETEQWTIPLQMQVAKTMKVGKTPVKVALEANYYLERADSLGQEWMIGLNITPVVPNRLAAWLQNN
jgi:hypothetical protein